MRHRIKQTYSVQKDAVLDSGDGNSSSRILTDKPQLNTTNKSRLLHSDKSTCFGPLSGRKVSNLQRPVLFSPEERGFREKMKSYVGISKTYSTCFYSKLGNKGCFRKVQSEGWKADGRPRSGPRQGLTIGGKARKIFGTTIPLIVPAVSGLAFLLVLGGLIFPVQMLSENVSALGSGESTKNATIPENGVSLAITSDIPDSGTIEEPVTGDGTKYIKVDFTVGANKIDKYDVFVKAGSSALVGMTTNETIQSISAPTTSIAAGQWGYTVERGSVEKLDGLTYKKVQTDMNTPAVGVVAEGGGKLNDYLQDYTLAFAANLAGAKADHYKQNILLSVTANATDVVKEFPMGFAGKTYMQEMTPSVCNTVDIGTEGRMIDKRDGKIYWVGRMKDGLCWMTQNLDFDLWDDKTNTGVVLKADNSNLDGSDVTSNWTSTSGVSGIWSNSWSSDGNSVSDYEKVKYFDPGMYYYSTPDASKGCTVRTATGFEQCYEFGWRKFLELSNDSTWQPTTSLGFVNSTTYLGTDGTTVCHKESGSFYGDDTGETNVCRIYYDSEDISASIDWHYLVGNYYSWVAAKAGSKATSPDSSVCPKGWKMPNGVNTASFANLFSSYGAYHSGTLIYGAQDVRLKPLYFLLSGYVNGGPSGGAVVSGPGSSAGYWTSTYIGLQQYQYTPSAYSLMISSGIDPSSKSWFLTYGMPVRCVAR